MPAASRQANTYAIMAATRAEEEIEELLRDTSLKSTNEDFNKVLTFMICDSPPGTLKVSGKQNSLFPLGPVIKCFLSESYKSSKQFDIILFFTLAT